MTTFSQSHPPQTTLLSGRSPLGRRIFAWWVALTFLGQGLFPIVTAVQGDSTTESEIVVLCTINGVKEISLASWEESSQRGDQSGFTQCPLCLLSHGIESGLASNDLQMGLAPIPEILSAPSSLGVLYSVPPHSIKPIRAPPLV